VGGTALQRDFDFGSPRRQSNPDRRSDDELRFYLEHSRWPSEQEAVTLDGGQEESKN
jgi:hypothetical protein